MQLEPFGTNMSEGVVFKDDAGDAGTHVIGQSAGATLPPSYRVGSSEDSRVHGSRLDCLAALRRRMGARRGRWGRTPRVGGTTDWAGARAPHASSWTADLPRRTLQVR